MQTKNANQWQTCLVQVPGQLHGGLHLYVVLEEALSERGLVVGLARLGLDGRPHAPRTELRLGRGKSGLTQSPRKRGGTTPTHGRTTRRLPRGASTGGLHAPRFHTSRACALMCAALWSCGLPRQGGESERRRLTVGRRVSYPEAQAQVVCMHHALMLRAPNPNDIQTISKPYANNPNQMQTKSKPYANCIQTNPILSKPYPKPSAVTSHRVPQSLHASRACALTCAALWL